MCFVSQLLSLLQQCLEQLLILNPSQLLLHAADFAAAGEEFDVAAVAGHGRGRGRGAAGAPGVQGPAKLRFLGLVTALDLEVIRNGIAVIVIEVDDSSFLWLSINQI